MVTDLAVVVKHPEGLPAELSQLPRTLVVGVLNVTPDSFSDGGDYLDPQQAIEHGLELVSQGADIVDVGGESTRPGATAIDSATELSRVIDVVTGLASEGIAVSIDTRRSQVAERALEAGAVLVNDVSGGRGDEAMWQLMASVQVPYVLMHNRGEGASQDSLANYGDVLVEVKRELFEQVEAAIAAGVDESRIVLDPGIGFAKRAEHNWPLVHQIALDDMALWGFPVLLGASRKRFLGVHETGEPRIDDSMDTRDALTVELTQRAVKSGLWAVRVHRVEANVAVVHSSRVRSEEAP